MFVARGLLGPEWGTWYVLLGTGACFTCNGLWLVPRALFRDGHPCAAPHVAYVSAVAALIVLSQWTIAAPIDPMLDELVSMLGSSILLLAFWEGLRGWHRQRGVERAMRVVFLATYGGCVSVALLLPAALGNDRNVASLCAAAAAATIIFVTQGLVAWRLRHPLDAPEATPPSTTAARTRAADRSPASDIAMDIQGAVVSMTGTDDADAAVRDEDALLARELEQHMRTQRPFLQPELKLSHLAQALDVSEDRISRATREVLGHRNISQYVNAFRVEHAQSLLANPACDDWSTLVVGLESGFGSLGAFHRAFKAAKGYPPGEFRTARQASVSTHTACAPSGGR